MSDLFLDNEEWNDEIYEDIPGQDYTSVIVYSRDWTVETILNQIDKGNIDLTPAFQRRNAWNDEKRSRLIESLIIGVPVPEIVLAESPEKKKSFIVIDGKQRLLTLLGFVDPKIDYWKKSKLTKLKARPDLNKLTYEKIINSSNYQDETRAFQNSDIRCTVISNYSSSDILYDIFYRLNTGSTPLSTQELRQVLNKGPFANRLVEFTNDIIPLHSILNLQEPDPRLRDIEVALRCISFEVYGTQYKGDLKKFLDVTMAEFSKRFKDAPEEVEILLSSFNKATETGIEVLGADRFGRKFKNGKWEGRFNRSVFEVQVYYFWRIPEEKITKENSKKFTDMFIDLCQRDSDFMSSIETTTKKVESFQIRFSKIMEVINKAFSVDIVDLPVS
jgi:Protein of unknown function DUF262